MLPQGLQPNDPNQSPLFIEVWANLTIGSHQANHRILTLFGMTSERKKNAHLWSLLRTTFIRLNELGRLSE